MIDQTKRVIGSKEKGHGPDWSCESCGSNNQGTNPRCHNCGADGPRREGDIIASVLTDDWTMDGDARDETKPGRTNAMSEGFKKIYGVKAGNAGNVGPDGQIWLKSGETSNTVEDRARLEEQKALWEEHTARREKKLRKGFLIALGVSMSLGVVVLILLTVFGS